MSLNELLQYGPTCQCITLIKETNSNAQHMSALPTGSDKGSHAEHNVESKKAGPLGLAAHVTHNAQGGLMTAGGNRSMRASPKSSSISPQLTRKNLLEAWMLNQS
ncbi:hypothetical protein K504DRAFT_496738 [Pleomassaria siparia CBS 279.74]|uniref:Uncharacterized protein n=1 Tax=Pleomassaria siparia CBS 279.74 TaxID=1314801 RepID=A0A6G1KPS3_9PLEO|nr:hypothetical protein K504DRAFT_496738 [Pleomassaria siparia CBS 279.74]